MLIFLITFFISFVGSIHPGPLNLSVIQTTFQKGFFPAVILAFWGVIPEIIYGFLAVEGVMIFEKHPIVFNIMQWAVVPIVLVLGILQIINSQKHRKIINPTKILDNSALKGFLLSLFNPQLLPYWIVILINYQRYSFLKISDLFDKFSFVLGTSTGAFALNYVYAYMAHKHREKIFRYLNENRFEQLIGWTFVGMGVLQTFKLIL